MGMIKMKLLPSCTQQPNTMSFRLGKDVEIYKTINSMYNHFDPEGDSVETPESWFTHSSESTSTTTEYDESSSESHLEEIIRGAQQSTDQQRLFFEPGGETSSILCDDSPRLQSASIDVRSLIHNKPRKIEKVRSFVSDDPSKAGVMMAMESEDPYNDFKRSMEEMVESLEVRDDWQGLEGLLGWYLKANGKSNHGYIIRAFVDLLADGFVVANNIDHHDIEHDDEIAESSTTTFSSASSSLASPASTSQLLEDISDHRVC